MEVYADLMVLLNAGVDLLLLAGTNRLSGFPTEWKRILPAAALGGLYSGACLFRSFRFLGWTLWRLVSLGLMAVIAFGWNRSAWRRCAVFVLLTMTLGGVALSIGRANIPTLVMGAGGLWLLCRLAVGSGLGKREYVRVSLSHNGQTLSVIALRDSGNTLRDPVTGEPVLVICADAAHTLTGLTRQELSAPLETLSRKPGMGLRLIPFRAVGKSSGMMLAMRLKDVQIGNRRKSTVVAFAPEGIGEGDMHQALVAVG